MSFGFSANQYILSIVESFIALVSSSMKVGMRLTDFDKKLAMGIGRPIGFNWKWQGVNWHNLIHPQCVAETYVGAALPKEIPTISSNYFLCLILFSFIFFWRSRYILQRMWNLLKSRLKLFRINSWHPSLSSVTFLQCFNSQQLQLVSRRQTFVLSCKFIRQVLVIFIMYDNDLGFCTETVDWAMLKLPIRM